MGIYFRAAAQMVIRSLAAAATLPSFSMSCSWRLHKEFVSADSKLRLSLMSPVEEPWSDFLDLRRTFWKDGEVLCTKRGIRISTSSHDLLTLEGALRDIGSGRKRTCEVRGLRLFRRADILYIRKLLTSSERGETPILLMFSIVEASFLLDKLTVLRDIVLESEEDMRRVEEGALAEQEEMEQWF